jgi:hypothetical protein
MKRDRRKEKILTAETISKQLTFRQLKPLATFIIIINHDINS